MDAFGRARTRMLSRQRDWRDCRCWRCRDPRPGAQLACRAFQDFSAAHDYVMILRTKRGD